MTLKPSLYLAFQAEGKGVERGQTHFPEAGPKSTIQEARESAEREHILRVLEETAWNVSGTARALGMERTNLHKQIRALGLSRGK